MPITPELLTQLAVAIFGSGGAAFVGIKAGLNGLKSDVADTKADVAETRADVKSVMKTQEDHGIRLVRLEERNKYKDGS